ncbi:MAG: TonB-dependent receptor [Acidobacteriia bacterium]|nr:TonB-dependent receptor [Terriglobia bacterium]
MSLLRACFLVLLPAVAAWAQTVTSTGEIAGTVVDPSGKAVPQAQVKIVCTENALPRRAQTDEQGAFRSELLPPCIYSIEAQSPGFEVFHFAPLPLGIGETRTLEIRLSASASFSTVVTAKTPTVDFDRSSQADTIGQVALEQLPINRRNFLDFVTLAPGVVNTATPTDQFNWFSPIIQTSNFGVDGDNGRGNSVSVDGIAMNGASGNVRPLIPQNSVREFQVNRSDYSAELGGATAGVVNVVSRSGGDAWHGEAFGLFRDRALDARNFFDPVRSAFTRVQSGASIGGPIRRGKTFFFAGYELLDFHETAFVPILEDPSIFSSLTPSQQSLLSFLSQTGNPQLAALSAGLHAALTPANNPTLVPLFQKNGGAFPFSGNQQQVSVRLDQAWSGTVQSYLRASSTHDNEDNTRFGALAGWSNGSSTRNPGQTLLLSTTWLASPQWSSLARVAAGIARYRVIPNDLIGPEINIEGYGVFGENDLFPLDQSERYFEFQNSWTRTSSRHTLKFGVDLDVVRNTSQVNVYFGGGFIFGGGIPLSSIINAAAGSPTFTSSLESLLNSLGQPALAASVEDPINALQDYALGLPLAYVQGFGNDRFHFLGQHHAAFAQDSWRVSSKLTLNYGLRYQFEAPDYIPVRSTFAPRFGLVWSPLTGRDLVIRGGYGIFYSTIQVPIPYFQAQFEKPDATLMLIPITGVPAVTNPQTGLPVTSVDVYDALLAEGVLGKRLIERQDLASVGISPTTKFPSTGGVDPYYKVPYSQQASFQVEQGIGQSVFSIEGELRRGVHIWRTRDANLQQIGTRPDGYPIVGLINPNYQNILVYETRGNSTYLGMTLQARRRIVQHVQFDAHYTWSKAIDDTTDFTYNYMAQNQFNNRGERGLAPYDNRHRVVANLILESPWRGSAAKGWELAGIVRYNSARPFNVLTGVDNIGDGQTTTHRPIGLGRDVGIGPDFYAFDCRLSRLFPLTERGLALRISAEAFNITNHTNFLSVNNIVGDVSAASLARPIVALVGDPSQPLSYVSADNPRQVQLGLAIRF